MHECGGDVSQKELAKENEVEGDQLHIDMGVGLVGPR